MSIWRRIVSTFAATKEAWETYERTTGYDDMAARYAERWAIYAGNAYDNAMLRNLRRISPAIYQNTSLVWKHSKGVVNFYAAHTYQGGLSTDGKRLADGTLGAIPIMPEVDDDEQEANLRRGIGELNKKWNWSQKKSQAPKMAAILGDVLEEIIDDVPSRSVYPQLIWPGYVTHLELDARDNVQAYTLEYDISEERENGSVQQYRFRKEVTPDEFRYYRDDAPWSDPDGHGGAVQPNPYGFVPAIWSRHESGWDERGIAATDSTRQALHLINSFLSHGIDHQRKVFFAPVLVKGKVFRPGTTSLDLSRAPRVTNRDGQYTKPASVYAETFDMLAADENASLEAMNFDVGKTLEFIKELKDGVLAEEPEGTFYQELRQMGDVSGVAAERLLGDSVSKAREVRAGHDIQTVKRYQMALSIGGYRANRGDWGARDQMTRFQAAFLPYDLDSYDRGAMDFTIADRPIILPTERDRVELAIAKRRDLGLPLKTALREGRYTDDEIAVILEELAEERDANRAMFDMGALVPEA